MGKIRKSIVNEAIDLLCLNKGQSLKNKPKLKRLEKSNNAQCQMVHWYEGRDTQCSVGPSKNGILSEIKLHSSRRNWGKVKNLILILLQLTVTIEPFLWRYSFIPTLYNAMNNVSNVSQFFKGCIGVFDTAKNIIGNMLSL